MKLMWLWQIPGQDTEPYSLRGCSPSVPVHTSSLQPLGATGTGSIKTGMYWEEVCLEEVMTCREGLGK